MTLNWKKAIQPSMNFDLLFFILSFMLTNNFLGLILSVDEPRSTKKSKNRESRRRGYSPRRYPRRIYARTEGIENIVRSEDALIGYRGNSTIRYIDTKLKIGPIQFILDNSAYPLNNTRVTSPLLSARFRLMV